MTIRFKIKRDAPFLKYLKIFFGRLYRYRETEGKQDPVLPSRSLNRKEYHWTQTAKSQLGRKNDGVSVRGGKYIYKSKRVVAPLRYIKNKSFHL